MLSRNNLFFAALLVISPCLNAEERVIVEASPVAQARTEATPSSTILGPKELHEKPVTTLGELLRGVPGVVVVRSGGPGQNTTIFIRGSNSEHVLVLIDGIEVNDPTSTSGAFDFSNITTDNLERVEIIRGPQTLKFGSAGIGGVVNILTAKGKGPIQPSYFVEGGSYGTSAAEVGVSGAKDNLNYSLAVAGFRSQGFSSADKVDGNTEVDGAARGSFSTRVGWQISEKDALHFTFRALDGRTNLDSNGGVGGDDPNYITSLQQRDAGITYRSVLLEGRLTTSLGYYQSSVKRIYDNTPDSVHATNYHEHFNGGSTRIESFNEYDLTDASHFQLALQNRRESSQSDQYSGGIHGGSQPNHSSDMGEYLSYKFHRPLYSMEASFRHDDITTSGRADNFSLSPMLQVREDGPILRVSYGTGFKAPSLYQLYSSFGDRSLASERSSVWEASIEQKLEQGSVALTFFENTYRSLIDFDSALNKYQNIAKAESHGFEFQYRQHLQSDFLTRLTYTYLKTKNTVTGEELQRRPESSVAADVTWENQEWLLSLAYRAVGARADTDPVTFTTTSLPFHDVVELSTKFKFSDRFSIHGRIENLLDRKYEEVAGYGTSGIAGYLGISGTL